MAERLKVLYLSHYFPPEVNAPAVRVSEMAVRWAQQGADVTVLTCFPNHPSGIIPPEYRNLIRCREQRDNIKVVRTYVYAAPNKGFARRVLNYLSFMFSSVLLGFSQIGKPDIIIATSPQFFVAVAGYVLSRLKGSKFIFEVRDLWPEEIVAVGAIKNKLVIRALEAIEMFLYRRADRIVAVARGTIDILQTRGISIDKMTLIPNGVDIDLFQKPCHPETLKNRLGLSGKFVVGYIGTHGMAHRLDTVLQAAQLLRANDDIRFLFVGDGAEKKHLQTIAADLDLPNVIFHEQIGREKIAEYYRACDLCLVPLRKAELFTKNIPSKIYEIMACARPIVIATDGESRRLVEKAEAGLGVEPENPEDLADKITRLYNDEESRASMGHAGLSFVLANCSRKRLADDYLSILFSSTDKNILLQSETEAKQFSQNTENEYRAKETPRLTV